MRLRRRTSNRQTKALASSVREGVKEAGGHVISVEGEDVGRVNQAGTHVDFMIGAPDVEVDGVTEAGDRVAVLRNGDWQI